MASDENPEWSAQDFARARPADEVHDAAIARQLVRPASTGTAAPNLAAAFARQASFASRIELGMLDAR